MRGAGIDHTGCAAQGSRSTRKSLAGQEELVLRFQQLSHPKRTLSLRSAMPAEGGSHSKTDQQLNKG